MSSRRYIVVFATTFLTLFAMVAAVNLVIDPYLVFGSARVEGFNKVKSDINNYVRIAKAFEPFRSEIDVVIAGNSRVEMGLDPDHSCFATLGLRAYNLGVPGAGVGEQLNYAVNVIEVQPIRRVILSVDFVDFMVIEGATPPPRDFVVTTGNLPLRLDGSRNPEYAWSAAQTRFRAIFSLNALISSVQTVLMQGQNRPDRLPNGFNPARDFAFTTEMEGPGSLFEQKMASLRGRFAQPVGLRYADGTLARDFDLLSGFLDFASRDGIEVIVLSNPFHQLFWDLLEGKGLLKLHREWFDEIERRVAAAPGEVSFWDFSTDSSFVDEPVPPAGMKGPPLYGFWEPAHYRKTLGDKMLDSILAVDCGTNVGLGKRLR